MASEEELVRLAQQGSEEAFGELVRRNYTLTLKIGYSILRQVEEAEDEVQNAWCKAWRYIGQFHHGARFTTWLTRIVVNQCLMRLRSRRRQPVSQVDENTFTRIPQPGSFGEEAAQKREISALIHREVSRIPPLLRHVLVLRDIQEFSIEETAARLGITVAAAKSRLLRARAELRRRLTLVNAV